MKALLINGSPHADGTTAKALALVEQELQAAGIETENFWIGAEPVRGCLGCGACRDSHRCRFTDDPCVALTEAMAAADGVLVGTPVYFAAPNGALCALLDRVFYSASTFGRELGGKPAAALAVCWRAGGTSALDRLNKYFTYSDMPLVSSTYWNVMKNTEDRFGEKVLRTLGRNLAREIRLHAAP